MRRTPLPYLHSDLRRSPRRRRTVILLGALLAGLLVGEGVLRGTETDSGDNPSQFKKGDIVRVAKGEDEYEIIEIYWGHEDDDEDDVLYAIIRSVRNGEEKKRRLSRLRAAPIVAGLGSETAAAAGNDNADARGGAILPNLGSVIVGWARGATNGFGASAFIAVLTPQDEFDNTFNGNGFALVKEGATSFFNDVVVTPHGFIAAGFGTNGTGTDGRLLFARFNQKGQKTGQLVVNVGPATDQVAELAYNPLRDIVYFVGHTIQPDTFSDGLVGVLNPKTMKLDPHFGGGDGMAQVNNPSGHAFFTSAELVANGLAACGVVGNQGMCHSFNYLGQTGALWGPNGCLRSGVLFSRCDTDPDGNIYCAALGSGASCAVCKVDAACSGAGFGTNGCQPLFPEYAGKCLPLSVELPQVAQLAGFRTTGNLTEDLTPLPEELSVDFNDLVGVGAVLVGTQSKGAVDERVAYSPNTSPCAPGSLCLSGNRFQVTAFNTSGGPITPASAVAITADTGYFTFLNPNNVEVVTKVVNACGLGSFWVFAAGLTNQGVGIRVRDTKTGEIKEYINPINRAFPPLQDTAAFATCAAAAGEGYEPILTFEDEGSAAADAEREAAALASELDRLAAGGRQTTGGALLHSTVEPINLHGGRFKVDATFKTTTGPTTTAPGVLLTPETAYFYFQNSNNVEAIVKVKDACALATPRFWVFAAGLTNVRMDITVTDTKTGKKKIYTNSQSTPFKPIQDVDYFNTCP